jgi:ABC-2 type transport system permease protein
MFFLNYLKILMSYKSDFLLGVTGFIFQQVLGIAFIALVFQSVPHIAGWSFAEILFIYGFAQIPRGIDHMFTDMLWLFSYRYIVKGEFDRFLVRPMNPLFQLIIERFQSDGLGEVIVGVLTLTYAWQQLKLQVTIDRILWLVVLVFFAAVIYTAIKLAVTSIAYWVGFAQSYLYMTYQLSVFVKYPMGIYPQWLKFIVMWMIPFAFTGYYPAAFLLGKESWQLGGLMVIVVAIVSITLAYQIWLTGMKRYQSVGN